MAPTPALVPPPPRTRTFIQRLPSVSTVFRQRPMLLGNWVLMMSSRPSLSKSATYARGLADCHPSGPLPAAGPTLVAVEAVQVMLQLLRYRLTESETPATSRSCCPSVYKAAAMMLP